MHPAELIIDAHQITPQWLTSRLEQTGHLNSGQVVSIDVTETTRPGVYLLQVTYSPDTPESISRRFVFKGLAVGEEALFYRDIAPQMPHAPIPPCYDVRIDEETNRQYMLLKDVSDTHFLAILPWWADEEAKKNERRFRHKHDLPTVEKAIASFEAIIDEYLKFQVFWWQHPHFKNAELFIHPDYHKAERELPRFFDQFSEQFPTGWQNICERSVESLNSLFRKRSQDGQALTLVHIDFHIHNIFVPHNPKLHKPIIFDWVEYPYGIGLFALAHLLITAGMPQELRQKAEDILLQRYHRGLIEKGIQNYSLENCYYDYRLCILSSFCDALVGKIPDRLTVSMQAFNDWNCVELLQ